MGKSDVKICFMSDLHLEVESSKSGRSAKPGGILSAAPEELVVDADIVILAGDIHTRSRGPEWAAATFPGMPVVMVGGNHEVYRDSLYANVARNRAQAASFGSLQDGLQHINWLEREVFVMPGLRVLGATLWTDFRLFGETERLMSQIVARRDMNDFHLVDVLDSHRRETRRFDPTDAERIHKLTIAFLESELAKPFDGVTVVTTHHAPSILSIPTEHQEHLLSAAYASDLKEFIITHQPALWVHGHIHSTLDYRIGRTRIVCNPRGYFPGYLNPDFVWGKTVEVA